MHLVISARDCIKLLEGRLRCNLVACLWGLIKSVTEYIYTTFLFVYVIAWFREQFGKNMHE